MTARSQVYLLLAYAKNEQARREPAGPAKALLRIVEKEPTVAERALSSEAA